MHSPIIKSTSSIGCSCWLRPRSYLADFRDKRSWTRSSASCCYRRRRQSKAAVEFLPRMKITIGSPTTSSLFFGVNISCAQCHDHPLAKD
jgi:hypothetical protein